MKVAVVRLFSCLLASYLTTTTPFVNNEGAFHRRLKSSNILYSTIDESIQNEHWKSFVQHHVGSWCGIQSTHYHLDEELSSSSERILCGTLLTLDDQKIEHTNFYVSQPVDFESDDAVIATDRIVKQSVAVYQKPFLSSKVCGSVALGGPGASRDGLSLQYSFRHENCRMRVLIAYEPSDFVSVPSTSIQIPSSMSMSDITISREKLLQDFEISAPLTLPPAKSFTESNPHYIWRKTSMDADFGGKFSGVKEIYQNPETIINDKMKTEKVPLGTLSFYEEFEENYQDALLSENENNSNDVNDDDDDDDDMEFVKVYDGGLLIIAPLVILPGEESEVKVHWSVPIEMKSTTARTVYIAESTFTAMNDVVNKTRRKRRGDNFLDQPVLVNYSVQTLHTD